MSPEDVPVQREAVMADAAILGDEAAARKHGVTVRTIRRYRAKARKDPAVARKVRGKIIRVQREWTASARTALARMTEDLSAMCRAARKTPTPENIHAVAGAVKILSEAYNARDFFRWKTQPQTVPALPPSVTVVHRDPDPPDEDA